MTISQCLLTFHPPCICTAPLRGTEYIYMYYVDEKIDLNEGYVKTDNIHVTGWQGCRLAALCNGRY